MGKWHLHILWKSSPLFPPFLSQSLISYCEAIHLRTAGIAQARQRVFHPVRLKEGLSPESKMITEDDVTNKPTEKNQRINVI